MHLYGTILIWDASKLISDQSEHPFTDLSRKSLYVHKQQTTTPRWRSNIAREFFLCVSLFPKFSSSALILSIYNPEIVPTAAFSLGHVWQQRGKGLSGCYVRQGEGRCGPGTSGKTAGDSHRILPTPSSAHTGRGPDSSRSTRLSSGPSGGRHGSMWLMTRRSYVYSTPLLITQLCNATAKR